MQKFKKGDKVIAIAGKDKGRQGVVIKMLKKDRVLVEGVNMVKKHVRPNPNANEQGGILDREAGIHVSNIAHYNPKTKKADRIGYKKLDDGRKVRVFKSDNEQVDI